MTCLYSQEYEKKRVDIRSLNHGIELNPLGLLSSLGHEKNGNYISFGYSYFGLSKSSELTFPVVFIGYDNSLLNIDFKYREFLKGERSGIFVSFFARLTTHREEPSLNPDLSHTQHDYETKFGIGVGLGYRVFYPTRFYWGISLSAGRYFSEGTRDPSFLNFYRNQKFIDAEFLKIGYLF
jgi:hypothetical protein